MFKEKWFKWNSFLGIMRADPAVSGEGESLINIYININIWLTAVSGEGDSLINIYININIWLT